MNNSTTSSVVSLVVTLGLIAGLFRLIGLVRGSGTRIGSFSPRRAGMRALGLSSGNGAAILAVIELGQLAAGDAASSLTNAGAPPVSVASLLVVTLVLVGVVVLGTGNRPAQAMLTVIGIGLGLYNSYLANGLPGLLITLVIVLLALWLLGLVRGFSR